MGLSLLFLMKKAPFLPFTSSLALGWYTMGDTIVTHQRGVFFLLFPCGLGKKVVILQSVGRGKRNEKQMNYQDVRDGSTTRYPPR